MPFAMAVGARAGDEQRPGPTLAMLNGMDVFALQVFTVRENCVGGGYNTQWDACVGGSARKPSLIPLTPRAPTDMLAMPSSLLCDWETQKIVLAPGQLYQRVGRANRPCPA